MDYQKYYEVAKNLAMQAGQLALGMQNNLKDIKEKNPKDLVTEADLACDKLIRDGLLQNFPDHGLITEEGDDVNQNSPYKWHVDPIDGTGNYSTRLPLWGVSVGMEYENETQIGIVFCPGLNEYYYAIKGEGAYLNGSPIKVNNETDLSRATIIINGINLGSNAQEQAQHNQRWLKLIEGLAPKIARFRNFGTAVYEGAVVAQGCSAGYVIFGYKSWDVAAISLIVKEAGGIITAFDGSPFDLNNGKAGAIMCNSVIYETLLEATQGL